MSEKLNQTYNQVDQIPHPDDKEQELDSNFVQRSDVLNLLNTSSEPLSTAEIQAYFQEQGCQATNLKPLLTRAVKSKVIQRIHPGVYANLDYQASKEEYQSLPDLPQRVADVLQASNQALNIDQVHQLLLADGYSSVERSHVTLCLSRAVKSGIAIRVEKGEYISSDLERSVSKQSALAEEIISILKTQDRPLTNYEMLALMNANRQQPIIVGTVSSYLSRLYNQGLIRRLSFGVYASLEFSEANNSVLTVRSHSIAAKILNILKQAHLDSTKSGIDIETIITSLHNNNKRQYRFESISRSLRQLTEKGLINQDADLNYCLIDEQYGNLVEPLQSTTTPQKVKDIITSSLTPLTINQIKDIMNERFGHQQTYSYTKISHTLYDLLNRRKIERVARGVYGCLESQTDSEETEEIDGVEGLVDEPVHMEALMNLMITENKIMGLPYIYQALNISHETKYNQIKDCLNVCLQRGLIQKVDKDYYAHANLEVSEINLPSSSDIALAITNILKMHNGTMNGAQIKQQLAKEFPIISRGVYNAALKKALKKGMIERSSKGIYIYLNDNLDSNEIKPSVSEIEAEPISEVVETQSTEIEVDSKSAPKVVEAKVVESVEADSQPIVKPISAKVETKQQSSPRYSQRLLAVLEVAKIPLSLAEITQLVNQDGYKSMSATSIENGLKSLKRTSKLQVVSKGVYASNDCDLEAYNRQMNQLQSSVLKILKLESRFLSLQEIVKQLPNINKTDIDVQLQILHQENKLQYNSSSDKYASLEVTTSVPLWGSEAKNLSTGSKIACVIDFWEGDVSVEEILRELRQHGIYWHNEDKLEALARIMLKRKGRFYKNRS